MINGMYISVRRAFDPGYFCHFASILEPRHIGVRPKGGAFWPRLSPEAVKTLFYLGCRGTGTIGSTIFFLIKNFAEPLASVMVRTEAIYPVSTHLTVVAASGDSRRKYSTGSAAASNFQTVYGLVQCTPDLSETDCNRCLDGCISEISSCC